MRQIKEEQTDPEVLDEDHQKAMPNDSLARSNHSPRGNTVRSAVRREGSLS